MTCPSLVQRLDANPIIQDAVKQGKLVVACAYHGWLHADLVALLGERHKTSRYVAVIRDGRVDEFYPQRPESVIESLLRREQPAARDDVRAPDGYHVPVTE